MVLTKPLEKDDWPRKELLTKAQIWTQVYGLPFVAMTEKMGQLIGAKLGKVIEVKTDEEGKGIGMCLAIRIEIDVRKQLKRRMRIAIEEDQVVFVDFKYERLSALCYCCGIIGHNDVDCGVAIRMRKEGVVNPAQYGKWLHAPSRHKMAKDNGGIGKKGGQLNQSTTAKRSETWKYNGEGDGKGRETETMEEGRGSSIISLALAGLGGDEKNWPEFLKKAEAAHGREKEVVDDTVKDLISKEGRGQMTEEMIGKGIGEGARKSKVGKEVNERKEVGCGEAHGPTLEANLGLILGRTYSGKEMIKAANNENLKNNGNGNVQNKLRRLARGEDMVVENKEQNETNKLGKRGAKESEKGETEEEDQGKRRKVQGEIMANSMAEAVEQPRHVQ